MSQPLLTATQAAERLKVSSRTVQRWAANGRLPIAHQLPGVNGALLFEPRHVDRLAERIEAKAS